MASSGKKAKKGAKKPAAKGPAAKPSKKPAPRKAGPSRPLSDAPAGRGGEEE